MRRILVVSLAVLVFFLALGAKLSLYESSGRASLNPAGKSKLWVSGEKLEKLALSPAPVLWLATLLLAPVPVCHRARLLSDLPRVTTRLALLEPYRFLRPPPSC